MAWPGNKNPNYQKNGSLVRMRNELTAIAKAISEFVPVILLVSRDQVPDAQQRFQEKSHHAVEIKAMDSGSLEPWMRDIAPTFVFSENPYSDLHWVDFNFNGWGGQYPSADNSQLAARFLQDSQIPRVNSILNPNRNLHMSRDAIERELHRVLNVSKIIWVPGVRDQDVTDAHIDAPGKVVLSRPAPGSGVWTKVYDETKHILSRVTDAKGQRLKITELPEADVNDFDTSKTDMVLGYVNYLHCEGRCFLAKDVVRSK
ncbi:hypothetical protein NUU61_003298 [Penicillium alfredii]|uniref:Agmatine deiminase n=1 Tax=Penicillium alfredii TaxID=1506179 RepID=A0A9W9FT35_9EURO|nr:uncharacterized protein NUU61_003298 [Penicillium alfredii]KAJ5105951.1 hypothetical protein NUU61_003298 [Penicillium alfredii]